MIELVGHIMQNIGVALRRRSRVDLRQPLDMLGLRKPWKRFMNWEREQGPFGNFDITRKDGLKR